MPTSREWEKIFADKTPVTITAGELKLTAGAVAWLQAYVDDDGISMEQAISQAIMAAKADAVDPRPVMPPPDDLDEPIPF